MRAGAGGMVCDFTDPSEKAYNGRSINPKRGCVTNHPPGSCPDYTVVHTRRTQTNPLVIPVKIEYDREERGCRAHCLNIMHDI